MGSARGLAVVRGGGDLATGIIYRLYRAGFTVAVLECERPLVVRRMVSVAQAVFDGEFSVEGMRAVKRQSIEDIDPDVVNVFVDPDGRSIDILKPDILVDAIMAKRNTGTGRDMASLVVGIGPGFTAPDDVHFVVETKRGHSLGRLIKNGSAAPDTGIPGVVMGSGVERLLRSPADGALKPLKEIGDLVQKGDYIAEVSGVPVTARISGVLRGLIHKSVALKKGMKIGDIDPRGDRTFCFTISDKALSVAGGVMEAVSLPRKS